MMCWGSGRNSVEKDTSESCRWGGVAQTDFSASLTHTPDCCQPHLIHSTQPSRSLSLSPSHCQFRLLPPLPWTLHRPLSCSSPYPRARLEEHVTRHWHFFLPSRIVVANVDTVPATWGFVYYFNPCYKSLEALGYIPTLKLRVAKIVSEVTQLLGGWYRIQTSSLPP